VEAGFFHDNASLRQGMGMALWVSGSSFGTEVWSFLDERSSLEKCEEAFSRLPVCPEGSKVGVKMGSMKFERLLP
jgi:hypothetical protein